MFYVFRIDFQCQPIEHIIAMHERLSPIRCITSIASRANNPTKKNIRTYFWHSNIIKFPDQMLKTDPSTLRDMARSTGNQAVPVREHRRTEQPRQVLVPCAPCARIVILRKLVRGQSPSNNWWDGEWAAALVYNGPAFERAEGVGGTSPPSTCLLRPARRSDGGMVRCVERLSVLLRLGGIKIELMQRAG